MKRFSLFRIFGRLNLHLKNFNALFSVKAKGSMARVLKSLWILSAVRLTASRLRLSFFVFRALCRIYRHQGPEGLIKYLKTCSVAFQQYLGKNILSDIGLIGSVRISRTRTGLPRIIPAALRQEIRKGDPRIIKFVLSIFNFYRNLDMEGSPKLTTITKPNSGDMAVMPELLGYIPYFIKSFVRDRGFNASKCQEILKGSGGIFPIYKSAPGMIKESLPLGGSADFSSHPVNLISQLRALISKGLIDHIKLLNRAWGNGILQYHIDSLQPWLEGPTRGTLGKLAVKEEAAGKVRLFALVDAWSQWTLNPLHKLIFAILEDVSMDGTFDQLRPLKSMMESKRLYSLDLTAATDRLPIVLQKAVLTEFFSDDVAEAWASLLVNRNYGFNALGYEKWHGQYRYAVGQPMGALSSWAMLAFTHHFLVQASAWKCGRVPVGTLYTNYCILGDDLIIGDKDVKNAYLLILKSLGMEVNISKSIMSDKGTALEFAKRTFYNGMDVSPFPLTELGSAQTLLPALIEYKSKYNLSLVELLRVLGFGWRVMSKLSQPLGKLNAQIRAIVLADSIPNTAAEAEEFFLLGSPKNRKYLPDMNAMKTFFMYGDITKTARDVENQGKFAKAFLFGEKDSLTYPLSQSMLWVDANVLHSDAKHFPPKAIESFVPSPPQLNSMNTLWRGLLGPSIGKIFKASVDVNKLFPAWQIKFSPWVEQSTFYELYFAYLEALMEISKMGNHVFTLERPEGLEGQSTTLGKVTPRQIRFFRKWSSTIQGAVPLEHLQMSPGHGRRRRKVVDIIARVGT